jgi:hypothetical protein
MKYNLELLQSVIERDNCIIDITKYPKINRETRIKFICKCGKEGDKTLRNMYENGTMCKICLESNNNEKKKQTKGKNGNGTIYTHETLQQITIRDNCAIDIKNDDKLNRETRIKFICQCGNENDKTFRNLFDDGAFCKQCMGTKIIEKRKQTSLKNHGTEYPFQSENIKQKIKQSMLDRYGVEHQMQIDDVKQKIQQTNLERYGKIHPMQNTNIKEKTQTTNLKRYGVENPMQNTNIKERLKQSMIKKYGIENPMQNQEFKLRLKQTILERYGVEHISQLDSFKEYIKQKSLETYGTDHPLQSEQVKEKIRKTNIERYGVEYPMQSDDNKEKSKITCLEKYGVEHPMQNPEIARKMFVTKDFEMPNGTIIKVQGYEPIVLQMLLDIGYTQDDIITSRSEVPEIWYLDTNKKKHRYYCDIYIHSENKIIEVKSPYTYNVNKEINDIKGQTCKENGFNFEFWIIDDKDYTCEVL